MKYILLLWALLPIAQPYAWGQCTSKWTNTWTSCQPSANPNTLRGTGHWLMYDFGSTYTLAKAHIWNANEKGRESTGFKNVTVDYSEDGTTWKELGAFKLKKGSGLDDYAGFEAFDFQGKQARYVLLTAKDNWGNATCYGIAEVKFNLAATTGLSPDQFAGMEVYPNPTVNQVNVRLSMTTADKVRIQLMNVMGAVAHQEQRQLNAGSHTIRLAVAKLPTGAYLLVVSDSKGNKKIRRLLVMSE